MRFTLRGLFLMLIMVPCLGCTYLTNRGRDAGDVIDLGLTFSGKPQIAVFYDFVPIVPIGYGRLDGRFAGLGGGRIAGWAPHYEKSYGLILWGEEELTFRNSYEELEMLGSEERDEAVDFQRTGLIGMFQGPFPSQDYLISCPHYLHLGWIGVVATPRYLQMVDFVLGWTTLDIGADDNRSSQ